jgi:predicted mannosyl-3-phosphoglycerate phosphatase (HAD superfamily)
MHTSPAFLSAPTVRPLAAPSLVIITGVDGALSDPVTGFCPELRTALDALDARNVPVVLSSSRSASELAVLQTTLGLPHPFVADGGSTLHIPRQYFGDLSPVGHSEAGWDVVDVFSRRPSRRAGDDDVGQAVRLLVSLYRYANSDVVVVGVGCEWRDHALLGEVDVPVVVRGGDHERLMRRFPSAYVTDRCGPAGWVEAILGADDA